jgi:undecaprenyl-diphosphatase
MDVIYAILLSVVEGITEFLPISSTGHLLLTTNFLHIPQTDFMKSFEIIIQLGAILAVVNTYWKTLFKNKDLWVKILIAFLPTAVVGFLLYDYIKGFLFEHTMITLAALFIGGVILILVEKFYKTEKNVIEDYKKMSVIKAFMIGVFQSISVIPGTSRAAASILGGMFMGLSRKTAVEFSFFLAIPTIAAASGYDLVKTNFSFDLYEWNLLIIGFTGSFLVAHTAIALFLRYVKKHTMIPFGIYRIILSVVYWYVLVR